MNKLYNKRSDKIILNDLLLLFKVVILYYEWWSNIVMGATTLPNSIQKKAKTQ